VLLHSDPTSGVMDGSEPSKLPLITDPTAQAGVARNSEISRAHTCVCHRLPTLQCKTWTDEHLSAKLYVTFLPSG